MEVHSDMALARTSLLVSAVASLLLSTGCASAPVIHLSWSRPPLLPITTAQKVALDVNKGNATVTPNAAMGAVLGLTQGQVMNKDMSVEALRAELKGQLQNMGFAVVDKSQADVIIKVVPTAWEYKLERLTTGRGRLDIQVDVFDLHGTAGQAIFHDGYWARDTAELVGEPEVMVRAAGRVITRFLEDLRPQRVSAKVEMDDSDPIVGPGLELCRSNQFEAAYLALSQAVNKKPDSSAALYDLGIMAEVRGSYDEAEDLLRRATTYSQKPIYFTALERVRAAKADATGMQGH
jgi:tetratricopeptide (TPR) repeat protein